MARAAGVPNIDTYVVLGEHCGGFAVVVGSSAALPGLVARD